MRTEEEETAQPDPGRGRRRISLTRAALIFTVLVVVVVFFFPFLKRLALKFPNLPQIAFSATNRGSAVRRQSK